ncbi:MAG: ATP-binding protein [Pseudomonadota bacterium]
MNTTRPMRQLMLNIGLGFALAMLLLLGVIVLAVTQMADSNRQLEHVVSVNNVKSSLASRMRDTLRDRAVVMHHIVVSIDRWEQEELFQRFMELGERYAKDRATLIEMQESAHEKELMARVDEITRVNQPVMFEVISSALEQNNYGALTLLQQQAIPLQNKLVAALDEMTRLQREDNEQALIRTYAAYSATRNFILLLGLIAVALVGAVALTVSRRVAMQTRMLDGEKTKFQTLFESNSDAVVILGDEGFIDCNPATLQMFGLTRVEDFLSRKISDLGAYLQADGEPAIPYAKRHLELARKNGHAFMEWIGRREDGSLFPSEIALHAMELEGRPVIQAIMRDISERKEAEIELKYARDAALAAARAKNEFIANVSHEIRTPMHGILGMGDLLMREPLTGIQREYALTLRQSAQGLLTVINDILDFSKIEAGKLAIENVAYVPAQVLQNVADLYRPRVLEKSLGFEMKIAPALQTMVQGDPHRVRQILLNLVDNAIKFTSHGNVGIRAGLTEDGQRMRMEVRDEGVGIAPEARDQLFNAFSQADASTTRHYGGTGLGLAICRKLADLMGGDIGVMSPPPGGGKGTMFWLELPYAVAPPDSEAVSMLPVQTERFRGRVLVAEDHPVNQKVLSYQLTSLGLSPTIVSNGREALEQARKQEWDLILMDWQMPGMDGFAATRAIRALPDAHARVPIVALSAQAGEDFREQCLQAGMNDYLTKPYEEAALISVLSRWLPGSAIEMPPPIDVARLSGQNRLQEEFLQLFLQTTEASLDALQTAWETRDAAHGRREAHSLRGAAASIAADVMFQSATRLEAAFAKSNWSEVEAQLDDIQAEYLRLRNFVGSLPIEQATN